MIIQQTLTPHKSTRHAVDSRPSNHFGHVPAVCPTLNECSASWSLTRHAIRGNSGDGSLTLKSLHSKPLDNWKAPKKARILTIFDAAVVSVGTRIPSRDFRSGTAFANARPAFLRVWYALQEVGAKLQLSAPTRGVERTTSGRSTGVRPPAEGADQTGQGLISSHGCHFGQVVHLKKCSLESQRFGRRIPKHVPRGSSAQCLCTFDSR